MGGSGVLSEIFVGLGFKDIGFTKGLNKVDGRLKRTAASLKKIGLGLSAAFTVPALLIGKKLLGIGADFDALQDQLRIGTGKTGADLQALTDGALNVFKTIPTSMELVGKAFTVLDQRTEQSGKGLEALAATELELARITGEDLDTVLASTTQLFDNWGVAVEDQVATLDKLLRVSQATGIPVTQLADELSQYGPILRSLGFDLDHSIAFLGALFDAGLDATTVMQGLKFALKTWTDAGVTDMQTQLQTVFDLIKNAPTDLAAGQIAIENFGARAGPGLADSIRSGKLAYEDLLAVVQNGTDTVLSAASDTNDLSEKWQIFKNNLTVAVLPAATKLFDYLNNTGIPTLIATSEEVGKLSASFGTLPEPMQKSLGGLVLVLGVLGPLALVISFVVSNLIGFGAALGVIVAPLSTALAIIQALAMPLFLLANAIEIVHFNVLGLGDGFKWLTDRISGFVDSTITVLTDLWAFFAIAFDSIKTLSAADIDTLVIDSLASIGDLFAGAKAWLDVLGLAFSTAWDGIKTNSVTTLVNLSVEAIQILIDLGSGLYSALYSAGADAVQGLIDGAYERIPGLQSVVNTLIGIWNQIPLLGHSPWPMMIAAGKDALDGLIIGAKSRIPTLHQTVGNAISAFSVSPSMSPAFSSPSPGMAASPMPRLLGGSGGRGHTFLTVKVERAYGIEDLTMQMIPAISKGLIGASLDTRRSRGTTKR